jgi:membrane protease subunit (stomatin/prohibitin family)
MGTDNLIFLEVIEWFDSTGREMLARVPKEGSAEIKYGAQLTVRESQAGVFFYKGKAVQAFGPGRHTLKTANIPLLHKVMSVPWGMTSPLRAEVYFVNLKTFTDLKWGTRDPVAFRDQELGLVRLRAFGQFNLRIVQPLLFVNTLVGTVGTYNTKQIEEYLARVIVSRFNDYLGENLDTLLNLPGQYDELSAGLKDRLRKDFAHFGLSLSHLYINSVTPPPEVQQAIDDRSRLGVFEDLDRLSKMKMAMAMEKAAENEGGSGEGMGMGLGFMMPSMFLQQQQQQQTAAKGRATPQSQCPDCGHSIPDNAQFCPYCGHQVLVFSQCPQCGKNVPPHARFCPQCGQSVQNKPKKSYCPECGAENLPGASFCNQCGQRL